MSLAQVSATLFQLKLGVLVRQLTEGITFLIVLQNKLSEGIWVNRY